MNKSGWQPSASREALQRRAELLGLVRGFFAQRHVLEVETPILSRGATVDPQIESLRTTVRGFSEPFFLATSPEFAMKRLLAAGSGDIFQICKVFRDGESGRWHQPEFTMIEWYRLGMSDEQLMDEIEALMAALLAPGRLLPVAERLTYAQALRKHAGIDLHAASDADLGTAIRAHGINFRGGLDRGGGDSGARDRDSSDRGDLDRDGRLDLIMGMIVGPRLGRERPTFICDYPASQASLARLKPGTPPMAARFELYLDGLELANGFCELADAHEQRRRFEADLARRAERGQAPLPIDERLLDAMAHGLPDCAGVALGFDRVAAIDATAAELASVLAFVTENA